MQTPTETPELGDLVRLCNESVVLQALALRQRFENETDFMVALSEAGFENARIAVFLGKTTGAVRMAVNRAKAKRG